MSDLTRRLIETPMEEVKGTMLAEAADEIDRLKAEMDAWQSLDGINWHKRALKAEAIVDAKKGWSNKLTMLVGQCISDQRAGMDVLAAASWDSVVEHWTEAEGSKK